MGCLKKMSVRLVMLIMWLLLVNVECRQSVRHDVGGGKENWAPNENFTDWAIHEKFYVGDWLYFGFNKTLYNVLEVNETAYENCTATNFITNITRGGRDVFNLKEAKTYYFICSRGGCCSNGMKLEVPVQNAPADPPRPPFVFASTATTTLSIVHTHVLLFLVLAFLIV